MKTIFGPVPSRRFGRSLGIDLSPGVKQCNFDCLYCELAAAKPTDHIANPPCVEEIIKELQHALKEHPNIDAVTVTANGEPTLYPDLKRLVEEIEKIKKGFKTLILTNASTITDPKIRDILTHFDIVKLSLDCVTPRCFKKLDRPLQGISIEKIIEGIRQFHQNFKGQMILEILAVPGLNTTESEIEAFNRVLPTLGADRIDLGTVDRPPAYPVQPLSHQELHTLAEKFDPTLPLHIVSRRPGPQGPQSYSDEEILATLAKRPLTRDDIEMLFDPESIRRFEKLLEKGEIQTKSVGHLLFYGTKFSEQKSKKNP